MNRKYGLIPSRLDANEMRFSNLMKVSSLKSLPSSYTKMWGSHPDPIDQLELGCCTGCGSSRALKTWMTFNGYKWRFMPSALDIYANVRLLEGTPLTTDSGASIPDVISVINEQGVCPEDSNTRWSWPFSASDDRWTLEPPSAAEADGFNHKVQASRLNNDAAEILTALSNGYPLILGIQVKESFESDSVAATGIIPMPGWLESTLGYHCVYAAGYGLYNTNYVDCMNSWGSEWGDSKDPGSFHIPIDYLTNSDLTTDIYAVEVVS
jgi:C1A family cysteine protease